MTLKKKIEEVKNEPTTDEEHANVNGGGDEEKQEKPRDIGAALQAVDALQQAVTVVEKKQNRKLPWLHICLTLAVIVLQISLTITQCK